MKKLNTFLTAAFLISLTFLVTSVNTSAQFVAPNYWFQADGSTYIIPEPNTLELGSTSERVTKLWVTALDALSMTGGVITGDLVVEGSITASGSNPSVITEDGTESSFGGNLEVQGGTIQVDIVNEYNSASGVTIDGTLVKDGNILTPGSVTATGTNTSIITSDGTESSLGGDLSINGGDLKVDTITEYTSASGVTIDGIHILDSFIEFIEIVKPSNPDANKGRLYSKDDGGTTKLYYLDSAGLETDLIAAAASTTFLALTDTPSSYAGSGSKLVAVNVAENALEFITSPGLQNIWETIASDSGSTIASTSTGTLTIAGGGIASTAVAGDTLTITATEAQNLWLNMASDSGSVAANTLTDTFTLAGGTGIATSIAGDTATIDVSGLTASDVGISNIATATYDNVQDLINNTQSAGYVEGGLITDAGSGEIDISAGKGFIKTSNSGIAETKSFDFSASGSVVLTDHVTNYVYVDYNGGTPIIGTETTKAANGRTKFYLGKAFREGTDLHILQGGINVAESFKRIQSRTTGVEGEIVRASGMLLTETGALNLAVSDGVYFAGYTRATTSAVDTSGADTFEYYSYIGGSWTESDESAIDNLQYNDVSGVGALATLSNNNFGVHWVYLDINGHVLVVYGQDSYLKLSDAEAATPPTVSYGHISDMSILIGRIIIEKSDTSFTSTESSFDTSFNPSVVTNHSDLAGLITSDDHTQYSLLLGRSGGQTLIGGTDAGDDLTFDSTSNATTGSYIFSDMISAGYLKNTAAGVVTGGNDIETADIATSSKTGLYAKLVTGTEGTSGNLCEWNADGDAVDSSLATSAVVTASSVDAFTNKTYNANGTGNSITNIETADVASAAKTGSDTKFVTGTAGASGSLVYWNTDGDAVDAGVLASNIVTPTSTTTLTNKTMGDMEMSGHNYYSAEYNNGNSGTGVTIDWRNGNVQKVTMTDNCVFSFTDPDGPGHFTLRSIQDAGGTNTYTWTGGGLSIKWYAGTENTWSTTGDEINIHSFYFDGTNYYGSGWTES